MADVLAMPIENPEAEIRQAIDEFGKAFKAKNLEKIISCYAPNVVAFDLMPPLKYSGIGSWRKLWQDSLAMMDGDITFEVRDLNIDVSGDLAVSNCLNHFMMKGGKEDVDVWMRWTGCFRKINGKWLVTHEHTSVPVEMESGKGLMNLKP